MGNALTGDYDAVLQVNETVFRRLVAHLHRNDHADPSIPTLPHRLVVPIDRDGMRGTLVAQVGVPIVSLIDGASDRVRLEIGVRGLFTPADGEGEAYLPPHIHGTVTCQYVFTPVDPGTPGWGDAAGEHLRISVDPSSVEFDGTATWSIDKLGVSAGDTKARIRQLIVDLLEQDLTATPHRFGETFRPDRVITLARDGHAAVAVGVAGEGDRTSIQQVFVGEGDVAVAISREAILGAVQAGLDRLDGTLLATLQVKVTVAGVWEAIDLNWGISVTRAVASWVGDTTGRIEVGLQISGLTSDPSFNWTVDVTQVVQLHLDTQGAMSATPFGEPTITVGYSGDYADDIRPAIQQRADGYVRPQIATLTQQMTADLALGARANELAAQLRRLDPAAVVSFDWTGFRDAGVIVAGHVELSPDRPWPIEFAVDQGSHSGYTADGSWVPGGRIDTYGWSWVVDGGFGGSRSHDDRWVLRPESTPGDGTGSPFDETMLASEELLPGIGGVPGKVTLVLQGTYIDDVLGTEQPFTYSSDPIDYTVPPHFTEDAVTTGVTIHGGITGGSGLIHIITTGLGDMLGHGVEYETTGRLRANTLLIRPGAGTDGEALVTAVREGLVGATVEGAGLQVVVLVEAGREGSWQVETTRALREQLGSLAPAVVYEDVDGSWARSLGLPEEADASWTAIVSPHGGVPWAEPGPVGGAALSSALDTFLVPSGPPVLVPVTQRIRAGTVLSPWALSQGKGDLAPPIGRDGRRTVLTFVSPDAHGTHGEVVGRLRADLAPSADTRVAVVLRGHDEGMVGREGLRAEDQVVVDPDGVIAERIGVTIWPTTLLVDPDGRVVRVLTSSWSPRRSLRGEEVVS